MSNSSFRSSLSPWITTFLVLIFLLFTGRAWAVPCKLSTTNRSVTICRPLANVTYASPIHVVAGATHSQAVRVMQIYLDGSKVFEAAGDVVDTNITAAAGTHHLTVQALDAAGGYKQTMTLTAGAKLYPRFAYVANPNDHSLTQMAVEANSGFLRQNGYALAGAQPSGTADNWRGFAYSAGGTDGKLYAYKKGPGGRLLDVAGSPYTCGTSCRAVAVDPTGKFVYALDDTTSTIRGYKVDTNTGALTSVAGSPFASGGLQPSAITVSVRGVLLVTNEGTNTVSSYVIDSISGALTPTAGSPAPSGSKPRALAVDPFGNAVYVVNYGGNSISSYRISTTGTLSNLAPAISTAVGPGSVALYPSGAFLYVTHGAANSVEAFKVDVAGVLHAAGTWGTSQNPQAVAVDAQGKYALVTHAGSPYELWVYSIDLTTGALKFVRGERTHGAGTALALSSGSAPVSIAPGFLYAGTANPSNYTGKVFAFSIGSTGGLTPVAGSPYSHPRGVTALAVHPTGTMLYAPGQKLENDFHGLVAQYWVNQSTGALTAATSYLHLEEFESHSMVVDPSGRFAYATSGYGIMEPWETGWAVPASGGPLGNWLFYPFNGPVWYTISVDPTGKYAYADGMPASIDPLTGNMDAPYVESGIGKLVVDPTGRFAWGLAGDEIRTYKLSGSTGALTQVGSGKATGSAAAKIAVDPYGRFVYVANSGSNSVSSFKASLSDGSLTNIGSVSTGPAPVDLTIDSTGHFLYTANQASLDVSAFAIDQTSGKLTKLSGSPFHLAASGVATTVTTIPSIK